MISLSVFDLNFIFGMNICRQVKRKTKEVSTIVVVSYKSMFSLLEPHMNKSMQKTPGPCYIVRPVGIWKTCKYCQMSYFLVCPNRFELQN